MADPSNLPIDPEFVRFGLSRAIQIHSEEFRVSNPRITLDLDLVEDEKLLPEATCLALFQSYLEILDRSRQDQAGMVWVRYYPFKQEMVLEIKNDARSEHPVDFSRVSECIQSVGGQVQAADQPGQGLFIKVTVPMGRA